MSEFVATKFVDVITEWAKTAPLRELVEIQKCLNFQLFNSDVEAEVIKICTDNMGGALRAIKYVKDLKEWPLKDCKEFVDAIRVKNNIKYTT